MIQEKLLHIEKYEATELRIKPDGTHEVLKLMHRLVASDCDPMENIQNTENFASDSNTSLTIWALNHSPFQRNSIPKKIPRKRTETKTNLRLILDSFVCHPRIPLAPWNENTTRFLQFMQSFSIFFIFEISIHLRTLRDSLQFTWTLIHSTCRCRFRRCYHPTFQRRHSTSRCTCT